jgi:hypothetical protein
VARSSRLNPQALSGTLAAQHQVIARHQAAACGMTRDALAHRLRPGGPWQRLLPGTYLALTGAPTPAQKDIAALLYAGPGSVLTGQAALRGLGVTSTVPRVIDVLIPVGRERRSVLFVAAHRTTRMPEQVTAEGSLRYAALPRALADTARGCTDIRAARAVIASAVQRGRCPLALLMAELRSGPSRDSALLRQALAEVAEGARSVTEAEFLALIKKAGLPLPLLNVRLLAGDGSLIAIPDAYWPQAGVAAEVDSKEWHLSPADWERTMARHARMGGHGVIVLHFTPRQIRSEPGRVVAAINDALKAGGSRPPLPLTTGQAASAVRA